MHPHRLTGLTIFCGLYLTHARLLYSGPEDLYAFPKHRVTFLNNFPVHNETVERWLREGLPGGEKEFLSDIWDEPTWYSQLMHKEIGSSEVEQPNDASQISQSPVSSDSGHTLKHMRMGTDDQFICLIPPAHDSPIPVQENIDYDVVLRHGWSLLEPLFGKCLYHRQAWFTYSYCHNQEIRQFKELALTQPPPAGVYEPIEDPEWEAFTLGRSPSARAPRPDVALTDHQPRVSNLEIVHGPASRYLVQRWGDGTFCDKTGKPREVEVQFHCSMTMTDSILLVREAKTCSYVLIVQTPRLCGEPVFKSRMELPEQTFIRCRQILNSSLDSNPPFEVTHVELQKPNDHGIRHDFDLPSHLNSETRFAVPSTATKSSLGQGGSQSEDQWDNILKRTVEATMEALMSSPELQSLNGENSQVVFSRGENGEIVIEILEEIPLDNLDREPDLQEMNMDDYVHLTEILEEVGYHLKGGKKEGKEEEGQESEVRDDQEESETYHKLPEEL